MKYRSCLLILALSCIAAAYCCKTQHADVRVNAIVPHPASIEVLDDGAFLLDRSAAVVYRGEGAEKSAGFLRNYLEEYYDVTPRKWGLKRIVLRIAEDTSAAQGAYSLTVGPRRIVVEGKNGAGLFYGVQTLLQLLPVGEMKGGAAVVEENGAAAVDGNGVTAVDGNGAAALDGNAEAGHEGDGAVQETAETVPGAGSAEVGGGKKVLAVPAVKIVDAPAFEYRGMHLDVARHFMPVEFVKRYIDYLAMHKMNYFHWHLTDDQGWRIESRKHPRLNETGSYRDATIIGIYPGTGVDSTRYGGYYTVEELKDVVEYAAQRYITIVPEIDLPGHCMAVLATYPHFGTEDNAGVRTATTWGIYNKLNNVLAPSEEVFDFLEDVFNELMDIFPGPYIHMGADECAHKWWKNSPKTQKFMQENGIEDEDGLQKYFAARVSDMIKARGRVAVGWDELVDHGLPEDVAVMVWRGRCRWQMAAEQGHKIIMTPSVMNYLNRQQRPDETRLAHRGRPLTLDIVYNQDPAPDSLSVSQQKMIIGGQGCMWTEYFHTPEDVEYAIFPRMSAVSEVFWTQEPLKDYNRFVEGLPDMFARYELWGAKPCYYIFEEKPQEEK